jgi:hypothetical protein
MNLTGRPHNHFLRSSQLRSSCLVFELSTPPLQSIVTPTQILCTRSNPMSLFIAMTQTLECKQTPLWWRYSLNSSCNLATIHFAPCTISSAMEGLSRVKTFLYETKGAVDTLGQITSYAVVQLGAQFRTHVYSVFSSCKIRQGFFDGTDWA